MTSREALPGLAVADADTSMVVAVWTLARRLRANAERRALAGTGLTLPDYVVLHLIHVQPDVNVMEVSRQAGIARATLSGILAKLRRKDLVSRRTPVDDRRLAALVCTPDGDALVDRVEATLRTSDVTYIRRHGDLRGLCEAVERHLGDLGLR
ncbi:MarR family winged helix-turn-helix transcriptional regulator [Dactylosporangium sp. CA-139066]|uniref:MarR family winged helix-turn-helix transcriptional regulator n=1 Tax=Dactylosporangium sp. CA-139066 TaxID=3239930 RepID=UPI003D8EDC36